MTHNCWKVSMMKENRPENKYILEKQKEKYYESNGCAIRSLEEKKPGIYYNKINSKK